MISKIKALTLRNLVQIGVLILTIAIGIQFFSYVLHIEKGALHVIERPGGVEGFLPIGALMGFKRFFLTGQWDTIHPAAMVILGFAALISLLLRKSFCGWFCPVGTVSEWIAKVGKNIFGKSFHLPKIVDYPLGAVKYLLLGFFIYIIGKMGLTEISSFINSPYYKMADVKMLHFFTRISGTTIMVLWILIFLSLIFKNFWCRYLCPYGALMSFFSFLSPTRITRNSDRCIQCKKCDEICPYEIRVSQKQSVQSLQCSGCLDCVECCPSRDTLHFKSIGLKKIVITPVNVAIIVVIGFLIIVFAAKISGFWKSNLPPETFQTLLKTIDGPNMRHP